jgi:hypothetical protein
MPAHLLVDFVRSVRLMNEGDGLRPGEGRALALAVERGLAPGVEQIEPLLGFASRASFARMHVDAERAAIDLGRKGLHEIDQ